jgi:hypothetical protein
MMKKIYLLAIAALSFHTTKATTPVWATDVAPILYNKCASCHHSGGIAPFALMTYTDAVTNASTMYHDVNNRIMPPWPPNPSYSHLAHERLLSTTEIQTISDWVNGGTPSGNLAQAPTPPVFSNNGNIPGTPDFSARIPAFTSTAATSDVYQCFVIPSGLLTDQYITALEAIPGNPAMVHHVLVYADTTGTCRHLDTLYPGPGYVNFGGVGTDSAILLGIWVPGSSPLMFPNGFAEKLPHNADIVLQVHYPTGTAGLVDSTAIHLFFSQAPNLRQVYIQPILNFVSNITPPLFIPANDTASFTEHFTSPINGSLLGLFPHMHLLGQNIRSYAVTPAGDTTHYIRINKWDFHWQGIYMFPKIQKISAGSTLYANAFYDNTTNNPENPNNPPQDVYGGENTTDEMMLVYFLYTSYQAGDENIIIDSNVALQTPYSYNYYHGQQLLDPCPNPAASDLIVKAYFEDADKADIALLDMQGRVVRLFATRQNMNAGYTAQTYSVAGLPDGVYTLRITTTQRILTKNVVVSH